METSYKGFKELICWKKERELRNKISVVAKLFPSEEKYSLTAQINKAARSITANIAEGYGRYSYTDTRHFFIQARGSVAETIDHLTTALDENFITTEVFDELDELAGLVYKLINGYIAYLDRSKATSTPPNSKHVIHLYDKGVHIRYQQHEFLSRSEVEGFHPNSQFLITNSFL